MASSNRDLMVRIESGFLYSATLFANIGIIESSSELGFGLNLNPFSGLMVGIAPTLIFLRASLASNENVVPDSQMLSTLRFGEPPATVTSESFGVNNVALREGSSDENVDVEAQKVERLCTSSA
ncbi:hypothetical protein VNI00_014439 [Paramarasmius palmivorus]|uniref:Uncharacterized protein n=1 Tax=Paramarasmius palmivorus TaxID=297713 RepID=A0AAW0BS43_9AGAR